MSKRNLIATIIPILIFAVIFLLAVTIENRNQIPQVTNENDTVYLLVNHDNERPNSEEDFWGLANRLLQPRDFDEDWIGESYTLYIGYERHRNFDPNQITMQMKICSTEGQIFSNRLNQNPLCFNQEIMKFSTSKAAKTHFDTWLEHEFLNVVWDEDAEYFNLKQLVDGVKSNCGDAAPALPDRGYYEVTNYCELKLVHGQYFVLIETRFSLDEYPVSWKEFGELVNLIQEKMVDPDADQLPVGLKAPIDFE